MKKILITSGATCEPIDDVRFLSNISTGRTGAFLAETLAQRQAAVVLLRGQAAVAPRGVESFCFGSTEDLQRQLVAQLSGGDFGLVVHCAAVSDYRAEKTATGKLSSDEQSLTLNLVPTPKLLPKLKNFSPTPLTVIGFKLTSGATEKERQAAVEKLFASGTVDYVVHNDLSERAASGDNRPFRIFSAARQAAAELTLDGLDALADWLHALRAKR